MGGCVKEKSISVADKLKAGTHGWAGVADRKIDSLIAHQVGWVAQW